MIGKIFALRSTVEIYDFLFGPNHALIDLAELLVARVLNTVVHNGSNKANLVLFKVKNNEVLPHEGCPQNHFGFVIGEWINSKAVETISLFVKVVIREPFQLSYRYDWVRKIELF